MNHSLEVFSSFVFNGTNLSWQFDLNTSLTNDYKERLAGGSWLTKAREQTLNLPVLIAMSHDDPEYLALVK